jgi:hypothetical protein
MATYRIGLLPNTAPVTRPLLDSGSTHARMPQSVSFDDAHSLAHPMAFSGFLRMHRSLRSGTCKHSSWSEVAPSAGSVTLQRVNILHVQIYDWPFAYAYKHDGYLELVPGEV